MKPKPSHLLTLYKLAELGANMKQVRCTTEDIARDLDVSQQTASRRLIQMQDQGLIERTREGRNQNIKITEEGVKELTGMFNVLRKIFEAPKTDLVLKGVLFTGLAEGSYYVSQEGYRK
ncbi:MAG TPA: helix-turn-helix domain-containing protein, partial [Candidatus Binatus sp.]|nr:helix-turn-helix domain-containing protein [Candidatus Binatus sp.]